MPNDYNPQGAAGGLFAPPFIAGNQQSQDAVNAWLSQRIRPRPQDPAPTPTPNPRDQIASLLWGRLFGPIMNNLGNTFRPLTDAIGASPQGQQMRDWAHTHLGGLVGTPTHVDPIPPSNPQTPPPQQQPPVFAKPPANF